MLMVPPFFASEMGNMYVEGMTYHQSLDNNWEGSFLLENAPVADSVSLLASTAFVTGTVLDVDILVDAVGFGRNLRVVSNNAGDIIFRGVDYLNQPMTQTITATSGTVQGTKAFKRIYQIESVAVDGNVTVGRGALFAVPFTAVQVVREVVNGVLGTNGTLVQAVSSTPSGTTGDVRGTYAPNVTLDGTQSVVVTLAFTNQLLGGLYGRAQA